MGKKSKSKPQTNLGREFKKPVYYPFVSICTPTFNRRPFIEMMLQCFRNQTYVKKHPDRCEWIIVDDGTDKIRDLVEAANIPQIKYFELPKKIALGAKRNIMHSYCNPNSKYIVYQDDDDYYPPERVEHAVEMLESHPNAMCAGSSEIYIYYKGLKKMMQAGPYGPNHATAGTFAFRKDLLKEHRYEDQAALAEEKSFLRNYTVPFVQLDPMKVILVFSHEHNTFDKRKLLETPHPLYFKESPKTVDHFIRNQYEAPIRKFFMEDIDALLEAYQPGRPSMKPDVLVQMKKIEKEREELMQKQREMQMQQQMQQQFQQNLMGGGGNPNNIGMMPQPKIMMHRPGEEPIELTMEGAVQILQQQGKQLEELNSLLGRQNGDLQQKAERIAALEKENGDMKKRLQQMERKFQELMKLSERISSSPPAPETTTPETIETIEIHM